MAGLGHGTKVAWGEREFWRQARGCQQESGIPEHIITGNRQNMSRGAQAIYISPVTLRAPELPLKSHTAGPFLFLVLSLLLPLLTDEKGKK